MKRAREQNVEAGRQEGEIASARHDDRSTASPNKKKPRGDGSVDEDEEGGLIEWNLLRDLPYVPFRRLLDFLSVNSGAGAAPFVIN
jgi:hypothetical protein